MTNKKLNSILNKVLTKESQALDNETLYKLRKARAKALQNAASTKSIGLWWPMGAVAAMVLATFILIPLFGKLQQSNNKPIAIEQITLNTEEINLELLEQIELAENLEFYQWLRSEVDHSSI